MAQQIRLNAPRNISSLKLRDLPALNIVAPQAPYFQRSLNRSCDLIPPGEGGLTTAHARGGPGHLHVEDEERDANDQDHGILRL